MLRQNRTEEDEGQSLMLHVGIDPGAHRCGWAIVRSHGGGLDYLDSGVMSFPRGDKEPFQTYRRRLLTFWVENFVELIEFVNEESVHEDFELMFEIVPPVGFKSGGAVQSQLAQVVATACQSLCQEHGWAWRQMSATSVKKAVCGYGDASKVQIRNAVISLFPELEPRKKELTAVADESDAIAIAAVAAGFKVAKVKGKNPKKRAKK
jgi:Holliday junction resolvasome RuvABC endonuclease subunit